MVSPVTQTCEPRVAILVSGVAILLTFWNFAQAGDALDKYDDGVVSAEVMDECHLIVSGHINEEKMRAAGDAAYQQLGGSFVGQRTKKDIEADDALKKRTVSDLKRGHVLVSSKGCPALISHAREILEAYRQEDPK